MTDWIIIFIVLAVLGLAAGYVIGAKKKGKTCIGCPGGCSGNCQSCGTHKQ